MVLCTGASNPAIRVIVSRMVLLQGQGDTTWRPVAFASRTLSEPETRYAQIVKEALALVYACEKFSDYILGKNILLETDHKH